MRILDDLRYKSQCFYNSASPRELLSLLRADGTSAMILYRMSQCCRERGLGLASFALRWLNKTLNGCWIGRNADFGAGFVIMHPSGVVINSGVRAGRNIVVQSGVVIGLARNGPGEQPPTLGSSIFLGAGAKVLGGISIGDNVTIGANTVVLSDVPDNATVVGGAGRIIFKSRGAWPADMPGQRAEGNPAQGGIRSLP